MIDAIRPAGRCKQGITDLLDLAEQRAGAIIRRVPNGVYSASDYMEAEFAGLRPIRIALRMKVEDETIHLDFTGTDLQVQAALNLPTYGQPGHYFMVLALLFWFRTLDPARSPTIRGYAVCCG